MKQSVIELLLPSTGKAVSAEVVTKAAPDASGELFRSTLAARLVPVGAAVKAGSAPSDASPALKALEAKIMKMIAGGASQAEIVRTLAMQLAESVDRKLGTSGSDVREQLQTLFAKALAPPGADDGAGTSGAARARALAARYLKICATADALVAQNGQQKRISGNLLDAHRAKDIPARTKHSSLAPTSAFDLAGGAVMGVPSQTALDAQAPILSAAPLAASAAAPSASATQPTLPGPGFTTPAAAAPTPASASLLVDGAAGGSETPRRALAAVSQRAAPAASTAEPALSGEARLGGDTVNAAASLGLPLPAPASGDGRRVTLGSTTAVALGGDNLLGRVLTRAALAADVPVSQAPAASGAVPTAAAPAQAQAAVAPAASAAVAGAPVVAQNESAKTDLALAAFIESFEAALKESAPAAPAGAGGAPAASGPAGPVHLAIETPGAFAAAVAAGAAAPFSAAGADPSGPALPAPVMPPIDHGDIADQVLRGAFMRNVGTSSEIRLTLVPETLGDVTVKLVVDGGSVSAHVLAQTPEVRDALMSAQPQLTKSLGDAGLKLTSFNVDLSGSGFAGFAQQQNSRQQDRPTGRGAADSTAWDDAAADAPLEAIPSFGPSVAARPGAGDYNYLA